MFLGSKRNGQQSGGGAGNHTSVRKRRVLLVAVVAMMMKALLFTRARANVHPSFAQSTSSLNRSSVSSIDRLSVVRTPASEITRRNAAVTNLFINNTFCCHVSITLHKK